MNKLPNDIIQTIFQYDPTYHRIQHNIVLRQLKTTLAVREVFTTFLHELIFSPFYMFHVANMFRKDDLRQYAKTRGIKIVRRCTKAKLITVLLWYHVHSKAAVED